MKERKMQTDWREEVAMCVILVVILLVIVRFG